MDKASSVNISDINPFNESLGIVRDDGKRRFIYPKKPNGRYYNARTIFSIVLLVFLFGMPLIKLNGHPFMMLNIIDRKFILFGAVFGTYDFFILATGFLTFVVSIILFTAVFGRVFCGWACPQTIFLEMVFRKIEFLIEGDYFRQKNFNKSPWGATKIFKKLLKWSIFMAISVLISNTFLAWIIGFDEVVKIISEPISMHTGEFIAMLTFTGVFYFIFAYFREYACIYVCPYGRLQGVLLDKSSTVIAYDYIRGEPRGKLRKSTERTEGDCIDCKECVAVCPTGIDIRNGTQLECVNCTACIDACDNVMDKISKPRGLIRFASENNIVNKTKFKITAKIIAYSGILIIMLGILTYLLAARKPIDITILRAPGMLFQEQPDNKISNLYTMKLTNKTFDEVPITLKVENRDGELKVAGNDINMKSNDVTETKFLVILNRNDLKTMNVPLEIGIYKNGEKIESKKINFLGPAPQ
ncbi:MAG: cytochrome c oxidase accessory protein CcoG [Ignavibacteria bacterium]|nr:cytochrome c oxidase accessory protein CcoG [Ignavibacteria bacterium]